MVMLTPRAQAAKNNQYQPGAGGPAPFDLYSGQQAPRYGPQKALAGAQPITAPKVGLKTAAQDPLPLSGPPQPAALNTTPATTPVPIRGGGGQMSTPTAPALTESPTAPITGTPTTTTQAGGTTPTTEAARPTGDNQAFFNKNQEQAKELAAQVNANVTQEGNTDVQTILDNASTAARTAADSGNIVFNQDVLNKALADPNSLTEEERVIFNNMRDAFYQGGLGSMNQQIDDATKEYQRRTQTVGGQANVLENLGGGTNSGVMNANLALLGGGEGGAVLGKDASRDFRSGLDALYAGQRGEHDAVLAGGDQQNAATRQRIQDAIDAGAAGSDASATQLDAANAAMHAPYQARAEILDKQIADRERYRQIFINAAAIGVKSQAMNARIDELNKEIAGMRQQQGQMKQVYQAMQDAGTHKRDAARAKAAGLRNLMTGRRTDFARTPTAAA